MLTTQDYRARLLYAYRVFRRDGYAPRKAYHMAKAVVKPLPEDRETVLRRRAFNEWARFSPTDPRRCKEGWEMCWQYARENL